MAGYAKTQTTSRVAAENLELIKARDRALQRERSPIQRFSDSLINVAVSGVSITMHAIWFGVWIAMNSGIVPGITPFDPFPFSFLNMTMSLEAIFLALFVLESQNRLAKQSEQRSNLDLQINLLAEREMTAALQMLKDLTNGLNIRTSVSKEELDDMIKETDVHRLAEEIER
ncbi:MAG TPA: DUF1003 domain-containing protein [Vicinamibacterales bacterium]|nr:DUF1003 domain-containing protein [Vicinamibacterales bacterium]